MSTWRLRLSKFASWAPCDAAPCNPREQSALANELRETERTAAGEEGSLQRPEKRAACRGRRRGQLAEAVAACTLCRYEEGMIDHLELDPSCP
eukprot:6185606-Pleurochrysis_carterae.AAC.2